MTKMAGSGAGSLVRGTDLRIRIRICTKIRNAGLSMTLRRIKCRKTEQFFFLRFISFIVIGTILTLNTHQSKEPNRPQLCLDRIWEMYICTFGVQTACSGDFRRYIVLGAKTMIFFFNKGGPKFVIPFRTRICCFGFGGSFQILAAEFRKISQVYNFQMYSLKEL
jgi:hypothetical protein